MGFSNEKYIEELMWIAHKEGLADNLLRLSEFYQKKEKVSRIESFELASKELNLKIPD